MWVRSPNVRNLQRSKLTVVMSSWALSVEADALTSNLRPGDKIFAQRADELRERFCIDRTTIQIEIHEHVDCAF